MESVAIGIIGTGNISDAYMQAAVHFPVLRVLACSDANADLARTKADSWGIGAKSVDDLLADPTIDIILNLTTPQHHVAVGLRALAAGKHVHAEKPLGVTLQEGLRLVTAARTAGLRLGCAPDTFLGAAHQTARAVIDAGTIGEVVAGTAHMMVPGHEIWHPDPDFYYQPGGGPMLDMGPYYLTCLVNMLGPVAAVTGAHKATHATRTIGSGLRQGEEISVSVPTHVSGILEFASGAQITITTSFDVWKHEHNHIELYGRDGAMIVPDPNRFGGPLRTSVRGADWAIADEAHGYGDGNYRILGLADMAQAILSDRPHRANGDLGLHILEIMESIGLSAEQGRRLTLAHPARRPEAMRADLSFGRLD